MNESRNLSEDARELLRALQLGDRFYIPKSTVEGQWSPHTRAALHELLQAGIIEEVSVYHLHAQSDVRSAAEHKEDEYIPRSQ